MIPMAIWYECHISVFAVYNFHNLMCYSNKCQLFCICEQLAGVKGAGGMVCELLLKPVNNDGYDATGDEIETYGRIMDSVHY